MTADEARFPTPLHHEVAGAVVEAFAETPAEAVLLVNSCARATATPESDIDIAVLIEPATTAADRAALETEWARRYAAGAVFRAFERSGPFARVHLDLFDGRFEAPVWDDGGGPDAFEIEIGNRVAHAVPLWERTAAFAELRASWLPYYDDRLRAGRLEMVIAACRLDLERVAHGVRRGLHFHAFNRLYHAFQEFLQAVFISRRVYPIAYDKWIRAQVEGWLGLPLLYAELAPILQIGRLESEELMAKAEYLRALLELWTTEPAGTEATR